MKLSELAKKIDAELIGETDVVITSVASLSEAADGDISFLRGARYADQLPLSKASAVIVASDFPDSPQGLTLLRVSDVDEALELVLGLFADDPDVPACGVDASASVAKSAELAKDVRVGPNVTMTQRVRIGSGSIVSAGCVLGRDVEIGENCFLHANVVIEWRCKLGNNVTIHANSTIGAEGFGYRFVDGKHRRIPHIGIVEIEDDVEIGSNTCIDRAKFGKTLIGRGTKIDNLVQIGHNVQMGEHCIIVSQVGISGSCRLGNGVIFAGQSGMSDHMDVGDGAIIGAQSGVLRNVGPGLTVMGTPTRPLQQWHRENSLIERLPQMSKELKSLHKKVDDLGNTTHNK